MIEVEAIGDDGRTDKPWIAAEHVVALLLGEVLIHKAPIGERQGILPCTVIVLTKGPDIRTMESRESLVKRINSELPDAGGCRWRE